MADDEVQVRIRVSGGLTAEPLLIRAMSEQGVQVFSSRRRRVWNSLPVTTLLTDGASIVVLAQGAAAGVKAGLAKFREWHPSAKVDVEDEQGHRLTG